MATKRRTPPPTPAPPVDYMSRSEALDFFRHIHGTLAEITQQIRTRSSRPGDIRSKLDVEINKGRAAHERLPLRMPPPWDPMVYSLGMSDHEDLRSQLAHYSDITAQIVSSLEDERSWSVNGIEVENDHTRSTTTLLAEVCDLISGFTYSLDAVIEQVWRHGNPVATRSPYAELHATVVPFGTCIKNLWNADNAQPKRLVQYADCLAALVRATEHYVRALTNGIQSCADWNQIWLQPISQFRDRYNGLLSKLEEHLKTLMPTRAPAFDRLDDIQNLRFGSSAPLLRSGTFGPGERYNATEAIRQIIKTATTAVLIVDNYTNADTLSLLFSAPVAVVARVLTYRRGPDYSTMATRFRAERGATALETRESNRDIHDRYLVIDNQAVFHLGHSIKDLGQSVFSFTRKDDAAEIARIQGLLATAWSSATVIP